MATVANNEQDLAPYLKRVSVWRTLFAWEAGFLTSGEAADRLGLDASSADWLRRVALNSLKRTS